MTSYMSSLIRRRAARAAPSLLSSQTTTFFNSNSFLIYLRILFSSNGQFQFNSFLNKLFPWSFGHPASILNGIRRSLNLPTRQFLRILTWRRFQLHKLLFIFIIIIYQNNNHLVLLIICSPLQFASCSKSIDYLTSIYNRFRIQMLIRHLIP